jgi:hypothetical protein
MPLTLLCSSVDQEMSLVVPFVLVKSNVMGGDWRERDDLIEPDEKVVAGPRWSLASAFCFFFFFFLLDERLSVGK